MPLYAVLVYANTYVNAPDEQAAYAAWQNGEDFGLELDEGGRPIAITLMEDSDEVPPRDVPVPGAEEVLAWCEEHDFTLISNRP